MLRINYYFFCAVFAFLPWVSFNLNAYDTQPWFLLVAIPVIFIALKQRRPSEGAILIFIPLVICIFIFDAYSDLHHAARGIGTYLSLGLSILIFNRYIEIPQASRIKVLIVLNCVWLLYAVLQIIGLDNYFNLVSSRTSDTRGFTSLATEPTFYGIFSLFQMLIIYCEQKIFRRSNIADSRWLKLLWWLNLIQVTMIAMSSMVILLVLVIGAFWLFLYKPRQFLVLILIVMLLTLNIFIPMLENLPQNSRPLILATKLLADPENILLIDRSINERFSAIYISIVSSVSNFFIPHGTLRFSEVSIAYYNSTSWVAAGSGDKIMSFIGALLFELGFISILIFVYPFRAIRSTTCLRDAAFWLFTLLVIFLTAIPVGFPLSGYLIAVINESNTTSSLT